MMGASLMGTAKSHAFKGFSAVRGRSAALVGVSDEFKPCLGQVIDLVAMQSKTGSAARSLTKMTMFAPTIPPSG